MGKPSDILDELAEHRRRDQQERDATPSIHGSDMGQMAKQVTWRTGSRGAAVVRLDTANNLHIGVEGLDPGILKQIGCALIHAACKQEEAMQARALGAVPIIGGKI